MITAIIVVLAPRAIPCYSRKLENCGMMLGRNWEKVGKIVGKKRDNMGHQPAVDSV